MALIDLGKLKFQWKGTYSSGTAYEVDDIVLYNGSSYVATTDIPGSNTTNPFSNTNFDAMTQGFYYRGPWTSTNTYDTYQVVTHNSATWLSTQAVAANYEPVDSSAFWDLLTPAPATNVLTTAGDIIARNKDNNSTRVPAGVKGSTLTCLEDPNHSIPVSFAYSVGTQVPYTGIATDDSDATNIFGTNNVSGAINLSRNFSYTITFPADGVIYSIKDPADANYNTTGTGGRIASGAEPAFVNNGGEITLTISPTTPSTLKIRNESGGTDEVTVTVKDLELVPSFVKDPAIDELSLGARCANDYRNTQTASLLPIEQNSEFGRGGIGGQTPSEVAWYNPSIIGKNGKCYSWGKFTNTATGYTHGNEANGIFNATSTTTHNRVQANMSLPAFFRKAIGGSTDDAKFLSNINGTNIGFTILQTPKIIQQHRTKEHNWVLTENGMIFHAGYGTYGSDGAGAVRATTSGLVYIRSFDSDGSTELVGTDRPKFKQFVYSGHDDKANTATLAVGALYAVSTDGEVFSMGPGTNGKLGHGDNSDNFYFRRINPTSFNNEKILSVFAWGNLATVAYVITETGKCWGWGYNLAGQLGDGTKITKNTPLEITAVSGSNLENKQITHVMGNMRGYSRGHTYFLTTEGKVYFCGDREYFGIYSGSYHTGDNNNDATLPVELTDAATTINSQNQKVVSMWCNEERYSTQWFITDGGTDGVKRIYSCGMNATNNQGTLSSITHGANATAQGDWFLSECVFRTDDTDASCFTIPNCTGLLKVGEPCIVYTDNGAATTGTAAGHMMLDSNGQLYVTGVWSSYSPHFYIEYDTANRFEGTSTSTPGWRPINTQPEPFVSVMQITGGWVCIGVSGNVYGGGGTAAEISEHGNYAFALISMD